MQFFYSRLQSATVCWRNELRLGPVVAHHQTVFVTAGLEPPRGGAAPLRIPAAAASQQQPRRVLVVQGRAPSVIRLYAPAVAAAAAAAAAANVNAPYTSGLLARFAVDGDVARDRVRLLSPPGNFD